MENKYHFALRNWKGGTEFKSVEAQTYAIALEKVYKNEQIEQALLKGMTLWGGLVIPAPYNPIEYDIP